MRGDISVHRENDSLLENITAKQLREAGQSFVLNEINLE